MTNDQFLIFLLALNSLIVAIGLTKKRNMWLFIVMYWVILFARNALNF